MAYALQLLEAMPLVMHEQRYKFARPANLFLPGDFLPLCKGEGYEKPIGGCGGEVDMLRKLRLESEEEDLKRRGRKWRPSVMACPVAVMGTLQRFDDLFKEDSVKWECTPAEQIDLERAPAKEK